MIIKKIFFVLYEVTKDRLDDTAIAARLNILSTLLNQIKKSLSLHCNENKNFFYANDVKKILV